MVPLILSPSPPGAGFISSGGEGLHFTIAGAAERRASRPGRGRSLTPAVRREAGPARGGSTEQTSRGSRENPQDHATRDRAGRDHRLGVDRTRHRGSPASTLSYAVSYAPTAVAVDLGTPTYARSPWMATGCSSRAGAASSSSAGCCRRMPTTPLLRSAARRQLHSASSDCRPYCLTTMPRLRQPGRVGRRGRNRSLRRRPGQSGPARIPDPVSGSSCRRCTPIPVARRAPLAVLRESIDGGPSPSGEGS